MKQWVGGLLVLMSLAVGSSAYRLWDDETDRVEHASVFDDDEADREPAFAVGGIAAVLFLAGVIVLVQSRN